jgi:hypothetical protein
MLKQFKNYLNKYKYDLIAILFAVNYYCFKRLVESMELGRDFEVKILIIAGIIFCLVINRLV